MRFVSDDIDDYAEAHTTRIPEFMRVLVEETHATLDSPTMLTVDVAYRINSHGDYAVANALCLVSLVLAAGGAALYLRHAVQSAGRRLG